MAFWLADRRSGQDSSWMQRFDPRFWTVNFPRPMMASVVTTAADALKAECEFHHAGELAGLIWDSEDTLDHPLLAYATDRDYARAVLQFHWRSEGLIPLDRPNGPTLTIEGRDAQGQPRSWYVRLWNYAAGTPEDARIVLPFSALESGYTLPGESVYPSAIDRMFISLVPPGYIPGSTQPVPQRANGWAELSEIECTGDRPLLALGDVLVPPHDIQMATAYDDGFNQTPARLVRSLQGLGYRGRVLHYVGMSHFFRLGANLEVLADGTLCAPAADWHRSFFAECAASRLDPVISLSYELFAAHCPADWQQRAFDAEPARTGWVPPSALLSPANNDAMAWLQKVAAKFVTLAEAAGCPVLFQIGEPWWWLMPDGRPCLYDAAAKAALGGDPVEIATMRAELSPAQTALLDQAGALLSASTAALAQSVRDVSGGTAEILLLAFTPTILDPATPEFKRANLPVGWAYPAFDRLQLEDYDWLTSGAEAKRRNAYKEVAARLAYPAERQDYLSGFVLDPADAGQFWPLIDTAFDEAKQRGISQLYVWAIPQVARDGYTRLPDEQESELQPFDNIPYPLSLGRDASVSPEFSTSVAVTASGHERRNSLWSDARLQFDVGTGIRSEDELGVLISFFRARRGAARGFLLRDPFDHSSNAMNGAPAAGDQTIGIGDGLTASYQLVKRYGDGAEAQIRPITRPQAGTISVNVGGTATASWTVASGGMIVFDEAPEAGAPITAGYLFDVPVRFAQDRLDVSGLAFTAGEAPSVPLVEIREAV
ncbi:DUF2460 domain-containing protein [Altererythrobacter aquiaggeris]|uniref:DUF2460 domain-containing protein n=1 Tax=Aestuarierythrobacter aquiaggeris TaxID=1898396 RepID=UPI00301AAD8D